MAEKTREQRIKHEVTRTKKILGGLDKDLVKLLEPLVKNASFMAITLEDLAETIAAEGCVSEYKNGENQYGTKKSPEVEVYNAMIKNYSAVIRQLFDLTPEGAGDKDSALVAFLQATASARRPRQ